MQGRNRMILGMAGLLIVGAIALVVYGSTLRPENRFDGRVDRLLPDLPAGWTMTERAIAESPEMKEAVGELLNFDDAIFVDYTSNRGDRLSIYIAYWKAGKMSARAVAGHTPDVCWVGNGWRLQHGEQLDRWGNPAHEIPRVESRAFSIGSTTEHVFFWHILGGEVVSYGSQSSPPWYAAISDVWKNGLNQRKEQFFIRLSSVSPLDSSELRNLMEQQLNAVRELVGPSALD